MKHHESWKNMKYRTHGTQTHLNVWHLKKARCYFCCCFMCFPLVFVFSFHLDTCSCQFSAFSSILSFRYAFCCISCDFTCFFNSRLVSLHFATMFYNFEMRPYAICLYFVVRDDKQTEKPDSQCPPGKVISTLQFAQLFPTLFTIHNKISNKQQRTTKSN